MCTDIVEVVTGDKLSLQTVVRITQTVFAFPAYGGFVETGLVTQPSGSPAVGHTRILLQIETLFGRIVSHKRSRQPMEAVDDQHRFLGLWYVTGRDDLTRETLTTGIDGSHPERIQLTRHDLYRITGL